jgi:peptide/nickel transport system substrate-binding protein
MIDPIPNPNRPGPAEPRTVDELVQARIDGKLSRRGLVRRAAALGFGAPVIATMLHATSDMAFGRPTARAFQAQPVEVTGPTEPTGEPQQGGTMTVGTNQEPDTIHPWVSQTVTGADVLAAVTEGLLAYDNTQQLQPALATEYSIGEDGKTYTFTLREGVSFHNGDPFTGEDVVNSWKMIMNPDFGAFNQNGWDRVADIAVDGQTLTITTEEVYAPFLSYVGIGDILPSSGMAMGVDEFKQAYTRQPIGTGPFSVGEWAAKQQIVLDRYDGYWGGPAILDRIVYRIVPDDNTLLVQLQTGEIDLVGSSFTIPAARVDEALTFPNLTVMRHPTQSWQHIDLKHVDFLRMTKVRQALDFATPTRQIIEQLLKGRAVPSVADQAPGSWAFNPNIEPRPYDLEQAKALLAEAGLTAGADGTLEGPVPTDDPNVGDGEVKPFAMELWFVSGDATNERICQVVAQSWTSVGVKTEVFNQDISTIWGPEGYQFTPAMTGCLYTWTNGNDPTNRFYWHSSQIPDSPTGSGGNLPAYFHPYNFQEEIDRLTDAGDLETDQEKRREIYWEIQELLHEEVPVIFMYWDIAFPAAQKNVGGYLPNPFTWLLWNAEEWYKTA